jgi:hypothetical protein
MSTVILTRDDVLHWIREDLDRAYADAERRLTEPHYWVHDGLFTEVEVRAYSGDGQKISKFRKIGGAINLRRWRS